MIDRITIAKRKSNHVLRQASKKDFDSLLKDNAFALEPSISREKFEKLEKDFKENFYRKSGTYPTNNFAELDYVAKDIIRNGFVKFEKNLVVISPYTTNNLDNRNNNIRNSTLTKGQRRQKELYTKPEQVFFYPLKNAEKIRLSYAGFAVSSLTIPIKWRFGFERRGQTFDQELSAGISGVFHFGYNIGTTTFQFREGTDNKTNNFDLVIGPLIGLGAVELNASNTFDEFSQFPDGTTFNNGFFSYGGGVTVSINKLTFGLFYGFDVSLGENSDLWKFDNRQWLGLGVGFIIFS